MRVVGEYGAGVVWCVEVLWGELGSVGLVLVRMVWSESGVVIWVAWDPE